MADSEDNPLAGYRALLCVTGGIACYKAADLASKLTQAGAVVDVAMTDAAMQFVAPLTFLSLTGREVYTSLWQAADRHDSAHLSLTDQADLMIVAPATANMLAKMSVGLADDLVSTLALSACGECGIVVAPAMNTRMWMAAPTQANIAVLTERGVRVVGPGEGRLACGTFGPGRMAEPAEILAVVSSMLQANPPKR